MHKEYAVTLTYRCNWTCQYCAVRNSVDWKDVVTRQDVFDKLSRVEDGSSVTLFGGEPGVLERDELVQYIEFLEKKGCRLNLETNGLFISRYPDLLDRFYRITYHCSEELLPDDKILDVNHGNTRYMLVIHDGNIDRLPQFLKANPLPERFYMVEATYPHEKTGPTLSSENKHRLMTRFIGRMTKEAIVRLISGFDFDRITFLT